MRAAIGLVVLLLVLAIVGLNMRNQLRSLKVAAPAAPAASDAASAPFGGATSPTPAQFQQELDRTLKNAAAHAASAGEQAESGQ